MKLISVNVENFRSITKARKIPIANLTTLVGPNNEGKSNILRALVIAMNLLVSRRLLARAPGFYGVRPRNVRYTGTRRNRYTWNHDYMWNHDFPLKMQKREPAGGSTITLEFDLTPEEVAEFTKTVGSKLNGTLPISYHLLERETKVEIPKPGRGHKALSAKAGRIADFVANKIGIQYIPAVRTAEFAQDIVSEMVRLELGKIENDPKFKQALDRVLSYRKRYLFIVLDLPAGLLQQLCEV